MTARRTDMRIPKRTRRRRKPFLPALGDVGLALMLGGLAPPERRAMATIAESADLLTVEDKSWLLVPASAWLLDTLAVFGAEAEDCEPSLEDEPETDMGAEDMGELDLSDDEPDYRYPTEPMVPAPSKHEHNVVAIRELTAKDTARMFAKPGKRGPCRLAGSRWLLG